MLPRITRQEREAFDRLLDEVLAALPARVHELLERCPLIVEDHPAREVYSEMGLDPDEDDLCGLHTGVPLTDRHVEASGIVEDAICIYRRGIIDEAGGFEGWTDEETGEAMGGDAAVRREIRTTILHELGHHFGLTEGDLEGLGYA